MIAMVRALTSFVEERPIVARERRFYGALPYLLAKIVAEGPLDAFFAGLFGYMVHKLCHMNGAPRRFTFFFLGLLDAFFAGLFGYMAHTLRLMVS
jgi:hypothetical protein